MWIFCFLALLVASEAKLPKDWKVCKNGDNECLKGAVNEAVASLINGSRTFGVAPLDPLRFNHISISQGSGPVNINLEFFDADVRGFSTLRATRVVNDWKTMKIDVVVKKTVVWEGKCKASGKILLLPIAGEGNFRILLHNATGNATISLSQKKVKDKTYFHIDKLYFDFETTLMEQKYDNILGNKNLADNLNIFLNENWREILNELKPAIGTAFGEAYKQIGNRILSKIETKEILKP